MIKKVISIFLVTALLFSICCSNVSAVSGPTISVSSASAKQGDTVTLKVSISNNPGINTFSLGFSYDTSKLSLTDVSASDNLGGQFTYSKKAVWLNSSDVAYNGEILTLTFKVLENAEPGAAAVSVVYNAGDISNYNEEDVNFSVVSGKVTIESAGGAAGSLAVSSESASAGETVVLKVSITDNPGINTFSLGFDYDSSKLSLESVTPSENLGGQFTYNKKAVWLNSSDSTYTGDILSLRFNVLEDAGTGKTEVKLTYSEGDISNLDEEDVNFELISGFVTVEEKASADGVLKMAAVSGKSGDFVDVAVSIENNPGIIAAMFKISYDTNELSLVSVTNGDVFGSSAFMSGNSLNAVPFTVSWEDALANQNNTEDGILVTFRFKIVGIAEAGEIRNMPISVSLVQNSTFNYDLENVSLRTENGNVTVIGKISGDANNDGEVNTKDVVTLKRYLAAWDGVEINEINADVNGDGEVSSKDVVTLKRFLANWSGVELK